MRLDFALPLTTSGVLRIVPAFVWRKEMAFKFPSDAWVKAFMVKLNSSPVYPRPQGIGRATFVCGRAGRGWLPRAGGLYLDLWHGRCLEACQLNGVDDRQAAFVLNGSLRAYSKIITGKLDPIQAMLTRQLNVKGSLITLMRNLRPCWSL